MKEAEVTCNALVVLLAVLCLTIFTPQKDKGCVQSDAAVSCRDLVLTLVRSMADGVSL